MFYQAQKQSDGTYSIYETGESGSALGAPVRTGVRPCNLARTMGELYRGGPEYRTYEIITYDVWGNAREGFWVNDAHRTGEYVTLKNPAECSDYAINRALGVREAEWDGDPDFVLYATNKRNGKPMGELQAANQFA